MNDLPELYPLRFAPILKQKVWGGEKLSKLFGKDSQDKTGESWEISAVDGDVSQVINGTLSGTSLKQLISTYEHQIVGKRVFDKFGLNFPLLFKFIDAAQDLSIQLHPDDTLALERHNSYGKTEMWYILDAEPDARLILGFNRELSTKEYQQYLQASEITTVLHSEKVQTGDAFYLQPGTVHAIGAGVVLAEIQQTSDITYRIYDWDRPDADGKLRPLHTEEALEAIDFDAPNPRLKFQKKSNTASLVCRSPYFETNLIEMDGTFRRDMQPLDSFVVYMCVSGTAELMVGHISETIHKGQSILIPACLDWVVIKSKSASILEIFVP